jgi:hypothetical protein
MNKSASSKPRKKLLITMHDTLTFYHFKAKQYNTANKAALNRQQANKLMNLSLP